MLIVILELHQGTGAYILHGLEQGTINHNYLSIYLIRKEILFFQKRIFQPIPSNSAHTIVRRVITT